MSLLVEIDRYLRRTGIAETTFGRRAVNDPRLVGDLRRGRMPGPGVSDRVNAIIGAGIGSGMGSGIGSAS